MKSLGARGPEPGVRQERHRIFIAVELDPALREAVGEIEHRLEKAGAHAKWVKPASLHFTLRFIGEIPAAQVARVKIAVREAMVGIQPFDIVLQSLGAFPSLRRPQVVWVGVTEGAGELEAVAARINDHLARHRFPPPDREFRPHLTLARVRGAHAWGDLVRALDQFRDAGMGRQRVEAISVMESELMAHGPLYTRIEEVRLSPHEK